MSHRGLPDVMGSIRGPEGAARNPTDNSPCPHGKHILLGGPAVRKSGKPDGGGLGSRKASSQAPAVVWEERQELLWNLVRHCFSFPGSLEVSFSWLLIASSSSFSPNLSFKSSNTFLTIAFPLAPCCPLR